MTGDVTQVDLPAGFSSGLKHAELVLRNIPGIETVLLDETDVVRREIVGRIIKAYECFERANETCSPARV